MAALALGLVGLFFLGGAISLGLECWAGRRAASYLSLAVGGVGLFIALLARRSVSSSSMFSQWQAPALLAGGLGYRSDPLAAGLVVALIYTILVYSIYSALTPLPSPQPLEGKGLLLGGASLSFILADNLLTLSFSWGLMVLILLLAFARLGAMARQSFPGILLLVFAGLAPLGVLIAGGPDGNYQILASLPPRASWVLVLMALAVVGFFPFHLWWSGGARLVPVYLPLLGMGLYALLRAMGWGSSALPLGRDLWLWLGLGGLAIGALLGWGEASPETRLFYLLGGQAGLLVVAVVYPAGWGALLAPLGVLNVLFVGAILLLAGGSGRGVWWEQLVPLLAAGSLVGVPPTPGFWVRWAIYQDLGEAGKGPLVLLAILATFLSSRVLRNLAWGGKSQERGAPIWVSILLGIPLALLGVFPGWAPSLVRPLALQLEGLDPWRMLNEASRPLFLWAAILFPPALAYLAWRMGGVFLGKLHSAVRLVASIFGGAWLVDLVGWVTGALTAALGRLALVLEGQHSVGWLLLWGLVAAILLLRF